jgi:PAS domain-containing protein
MLHQNGTMLARYPHIDTLIGKNFRTARLMSRMLAGGGNQTLRLQSTVDGKPRIGSAGELSHFPIVIVVTRTVDEALADWRAQTKFLVVAAGLSAMVVAILLFVIVRRMRWQHEESQHRLEQEKHRLDTALNNMTQGLVLYDASARVVLCNQRYIDMYGLSTDVVKPGTDFRDIIRHRKDTGHSRGISTSSVRRFAEMSLRARSPIACSNLPMAVSYISSIGRCRRAAGLRPWRT